jgi:hypothetical protein
MYNSRFLSTFQITRPTDREGHATLKPTHDKSIMSIFAMSSVLIFFIIPDAALPNIYAHRRYFFNGTFLFGGGAEDDNL